VSAVPPGDGRDVRAILGALAHTEGVRGALLVAPDGLVIASELPEGIGVEALSALAATLGRELELRASLPGHGAFSVARFEGHAGIMILGTTAIGFVVVLAGTGTDEARLAEEVRAAVDVIERAWRAPALA
jgi:predicted regulator of Ras-like GTPase activity (Roadblock/LC7/MglB family)